LARGISLVSRNHSDFKRISELTVQAY
jgi:predicted nucleic acid-binding protein